MVARTAFQQQHRGRAAALAQLAEFVGRMPSPRRRLHPHFPPAARNSSCEPLPQRQSVPGVLWNQDHVLAARKSR